MSSPLPSVRVAVLALVGGLVLATAPPVGADSTPRTELVQVGKSADDGRSFGESAARVFDGCLLRPLGAAQVVVGFGFFVGSAPLTALSRQVPEAWDILVMEPVEYTFQRPLGEP